MFGKYRSQLGRKSHKCKKLINNIIILTKTSSDASGRLMRLEELLMKWTMMKFKLKKSRSMSQAGGKHQELHDVVAGKRISTVKRDPTKSQGTCYSILLAEQHLGVKAETYENESDLEYQGQ